MQDEPALLEAARRLDPEALTAIFDHYAPAIFNFVYYLCQDEEESDSVVGDTFETLLELFSSGKGPETSLRLCIFQIAYSSVMDDARPLGHVMDLETVVEVTQNRRVIPTWTQCDESTLLSKLRAAINHDLSGIQRHVLILRYIEGFSLQDTAAIIGKKVDHVRSLQSSSISRLRKSLCL